MDKTYQWNPLAAVGLGFLVSFIVLIFSLFQDGTEFLTIAKLMVQLFGPPAFMLVMTLVRNNQQFKSKTRPQKTPPAL
jgi:hypothetical protein